MNESTPLHRMSFGMHQSKTAMNKWIAKFSTFPHAYEVASRYFIQFFLLDLHQCSSLQQWIQIIVMNEQQFAKDLYIDLDLNPDEPGYFDLVRYCIKIAKMKHGNGVREKAYKAYQWLYRNENIDELKINAYKNILGYLEGDKLALEKTLHKIGKK